ncbi:unnamed protein product [Chilo suppressalis]|uniref:Uncharacterized protein n=1 Tax=Chilo suppressalis TaxID=168631 RepID=A0ABN8L4C6_CHISP|nr:unnamed protein product [Chilo suppressalis]
MSALELLAEFDPFRREHIEQRELRPNPVISYLSKIVYEEIIEIMGKQKPFWKQMDYLLLDNCRIQSYDNAANMAGIYNGVQALQKEKKTEGYVPFAAHSLILVGQESVKVATEIVTFFGIVQQIYVFFSASTHRWELLNHKQN